MLVLGHRGASVAAAENTPAAFSLADAMGADGVELDVRRVADGRLLVAHDPLPDSLAGIDALELATLADVLDACGDRMLVNVEIKNWKAESGYDPTMTMVAPIIDELRRRGPQAAHRWLISSFSWSTLAACREYAPEIATGWLTTAAVDDSTLVRLAAAGHRALHPWDEQVDGTLVERCHRNGLAVNTWTCNDPARLVALADLGVDGVCTDLPDVALRAFGRDGVVAEPAWPDHR
ncbi:MAG TPA: glycerophosphodiester phosphodiesterase [Ilumatobacteraceae bacterium]|nr:glycerophosphodiester phosphodiesterase [Ilumatobacteraceae bacterium]